MNISNQYEKWKIFQSSWDDEDFINSLTGFMKLRYRRLDEKVYALLDSYLAFNPEKKFYFLDVGCGRLEFADFLTQQWRTPHEKGPSTQWHYIGLEPSQVQLNQRSLSTPDMEIIQATGENIPLAEMSVHAVLVKEALDHCFDPQKVLQEIYRVLKPNGIVVITLTNDQSYYKRLFPWINHSKKIRQTDHLNFFDANALKKIVQEANFDKIHLETYNYLKLPNGFEKYLSGLSENIQRSLLTITDRWGSGLYPMGGGGMILTAYRPAVKLSIKSRGEI